MVDLRWLEGVFMNLCFVFVIFLPDGSSIPETFLSRHGVRWCSPSPPPPLLRLPSLSLRPPAEPRTPTSSPKREPERDRRRLWAPAANSASTIDDVIVWRGFERSTLLMMCQSKQLHGVINDSPMPPPSEHCPRCATAGWLHSALRWHAVDSVHATIFND